MFDEIENETFDQRELRILKFWQEERIFERSVSDKERIPIFPFMMALLLRPDCPIMAIFWPERLKMSFCAIRR